jgi:hypothetical protein
MLIHLSLLEKLYSHKFLMSKSEQNQTFDRVKGEEPSLSSSLATFICPNLQAIWRGISPISFAASGLAPDFNRISAHFSVSYNLAAKCKGVSLCFPPFT